MKTIKSYILGMYEFRSAFTSRATNPDAYDKGRELAHKLTLRRYEDA